LNAWTAQENLRNTLTRGGAHPARVPRLKLEKNMIFWRKIVIFHTLKWKSSCEQGRIQDFKLGWAHVKKIAPSGGRHEHFLDIVLSVLLLLSILLSVRLLLAIVLSVLLLFAIALSVLLLFAIALSVLLLLAIALSARLLLAIV
jgi:hypothetical protein